MQFIVRPVLSFGIARASFPLESLAVWPVVLSVLFLFRSTAMAFQEVVVALLKSAEEYSPLKRFARMLGTGLSSVLFLIGITPLGSLIFRYASGLKDDLLYFTVLPTLIVAVIPFVTSFISLYRGVLIFRKETRVIANAVLLNSVVLMTVILSGPALFSVPGGIIAAAAYMVSMVVEVLYLKAKVSHQSIVQTNRKIRYTG